MTRWKSNYDVHQSYEVYTFANKSSTYWPTNNCSRPLAKSTLTELVTALVTLGTTDANKKQRIVIDGFEMIHDGNHDVRVKVDDVEGYANESEGRVLKPGEIWNPPFRVHHHFSFYTSSNVSQLIRLSIGAYA